MTADTILTDIAFISDNWPDLLAQRHPGTARPWRQALLDPDRRAAMAARDRAERECRDPDALGFTAAPLHLDVLDTIVDAWVALDELVALISPDWRRAAAGGAVDRKAAERGPAHVTEIDTMVEFIRDWLPRTIDVLPPVKVDRIGRRLAGIVTEATRVLGLVRAGQLLNGALCPWCRGVTPKHPAGGAVTMRVEVIPGSDRMGTEDAAAVVCWNPLCTPPDDQCGTWYRGRPAWPWHEWEWLADRLIIAEPAGTMPAAATWWDDPSVFVIEHSGRSGVDQALTVLVPSERPAFTPGGGGEVRFVGGPFAGDLRRFTEIRDVLGVTRTKPTDRPQLDAAGADDALDGAYYFAIVNDQPSYVWAGEAAAS